MGTWENSVIFFVTCKKPKGMLKISSFEMTKVTEKLIIWQVILKDIDVYGNLLYQRIWYESGCQYEVFKGVQIMWIESRSFLAHVHVSWRDLVAMSMTFQKGSGAKLSNF